LILAMQLNLFAEAPVEMGASLKSSADFTGPAEWQIIPIRRIPVDKPLVDTPAQCTDYWRRHIATAPAFNVCAEHLVAVLLNTKLRSVGHHVISVGTLNEALGHPREIFRAAIIGAAYAVILMHNHPSGDPTPSEADRRLTQRIRSSAELLAIRLLDHIIVGEKSGDLGHFSFRESGLL
jgi:DNA repair protein RadC